MFNAMQEKEMSTSKKYGVRYQVFAGKDQRLVTKEKFFATEKALTKFVEKLEETDGFYQVCGYTL